MSKKSRGPNFSLNEKEILVHLITKYKDVIENKKTDAVTTAAKNEGWRILTEEFNSLSSFCVRYTDQLKTCWENIKRNTRKDTVKTRKGILSQTTDLQGQVEVLLGPNLGLDNPYDSDANSQHQEEHELPTVYKCKMDATQLEPRATSATGSHSNDSINATQEDDSTPAPVTILHEGTPGPSTTSMLKDECLKPEDKHTSNGWIPPAFKTNMDASSTKKNDSPALVRRRRLNAAMHDKLLQSKLELVELMKKNAESEAKIKTAILEEQLKQEKLKTKALELQLNLTL